MRSIRSNGRPLVGPSRQRNVKISAENHRWLTMLGVVMDEPVARVADLVISTARASLINDPEVTR